jgi:hypothetical protein
LQVRLIHVGQVDCPRRIGAAANDAVFRGIEAEVGNIADFAEGPYHLLCESGNAGLAEKAVE